MLPEKLNAPRIGPLAPAAAKTALPLFGKHVWPLKAEPGVK